MAIQSKRSKARLSNKTRLFSVSFTAVLLQHSGMALAQEAAVKDENNLEEIVISGLRAAEKNAIDIKRNAASIIDAISATDIGKLPDATITDSLQRVTGVQITRTGGEGTRLNIRGNGNVTTTLNGEQMLSAGTITTVTPDFADIPTTMVSGIEVFKSAQAKDVVSGLAGTVNLKTNRPFLLKNGFTALGKVEAVRGSLGKQTDGTYMGFFGYNHDNEFGATLNVSKGTSHLADYWNGAQGGNPGGQITGQYSGWRNIASEATGFVINNVDVNGDGTFNDVYYMNEGHQAANRFIDRDRTGINGAVQWKINDAFQVTGEAFYTKMKEYTYMAAFVAEQSFTTTIGWATPDVGATHAYPNITHDFSTNSTTVQPGNLYTVESALWQTPLVKAQNQTIATDKDSLNTNIELKYDKGGPFTANLRWAYGKADDNFSNSIVDSTLTDGTQFGDFYRPAGGTQTPANPWGYGGLPPVLPDGTTVPNTITQVPIHISYVGGKQNWVLPSNLPITNADGTPGIATNEVLGSNLNRYSPKSSNVIGTYTNAKLNILRFDGSYAFNSSLLGTLKSLDFGVRYAQSDVAKEGWIAGLLRTNAYGDPFLARWKDTVSPAPVTGESYVSPISFTALNQQGMIKPISDFYGTTGIGTIYFIDPKAMKDPLAWATAMYGPHLLVPDAANTYTINDKVSSIYLQANIDHDIAGHAFKGNFGFRYVKTKYTINQTVAGSATSTVINGVSYLLGPGMVASVGSTVAAINKYSDFLPSIQLSFDLTSDQKLRFSFTKTVGTNNTDQLGGGLNVNYTGQCGVTRPNGGPVACATSGSQNGNPALLPPRQLNADLSYEWYFNESSLLSVGVFWVQGLTSFINTNIYRNDIPDDDGVIRGYNPDGGTFTGVIPILSQITLNKKGDASKGVEIGYRQAFDFLPRLWSGFGVDANFTYSPSTGIDLDYYGNISPGQDNSKYQSNFALWYEKSGWEARIAHNYRSRRYIGQTQQGNYAFAFYQRATQYLDASVSYEFYKNMTLSLQVNNITQTYQQNYNQWESNVESTFYNERRYTLGIQAKF